MPNILGIDYGVKRIGTAIADTEVRIATPLDVIRGQNDVTRDARSVADFAEAQDVDAFVVGLPLNMGDSGDSPQTTLMRKFAAELRRLSKKPVHLQDERLSSVAAEEVLDAAGVPLSKRKGLTDMIAAQKILQAWLDQP